MASILPLSGAVAEGQNGSAHDPVCAELLDYLREHPNAMDSLTGIAEWWLPRHRVRVSVERVAQALETLEAQGVIERVGGAERPLFRLRPQAAVGPDDAGKRGNS